MPGPTPREAHEAYFIAFRQALTCLSRTAVVITTGFRQRSDPHTATINGGTSVRLHGETRLQFLLRFEYTIEQAPSAGLWEIRPQGYWYEFDLAGGPELLAYHWHPRALGAVTLPHLHLKAGAQVGYERLTASHIPTAAVDLQTVLEFAIDALGVEPQRTDWREVLARTQRTMQGG